jgi:NAD(P)-dependent dehydrogenase (short-subunit alcohol dehydrogenase family)
LSRLVGRVCVVTGAASGIGLAVAQAMLQERATVVGLDRETGRTRFQQVECDVADADGVSEAVAGIRERYGRIDVLVNAAGIHRAGTVVETSVQSWDEVINVNLRGAFLVSRACLEAMLSRRHGVIVNVGSVAGLVGGRGSAAYSASKGGLIALTRSMALDHGADGVRVNCICPGMVRTPMLDGTEARLTAEQVARLTAERVRLHPLGRIGTVADIVPAALYLATDDSAWVTGSVMTVDGGYTAQ